MQLSLSKPVMVLIARALFGAGGASFERCLHDVVSARIDVVMLGAGVCLFGLIAWRQRRAARPKIVLTLR